MLVSELDTPCLTVDLDVFDANVAALLERLRHVRVRPHLKTAKSPVVAERLLKAGARGICVAKLGEAEVMLDAGIGDVLITTPLVGAAKHDRLRDLVARHPDKRVAVVADSVAARPDAPVDVLLDVDVGQGRTGVAPEDAAALAAAIEPVGVQGYEGHLQHVRDPEERRRRNATAMQHLAVAVKAVRKAGFPVPWVTTGGTGTAELCAAHKVVTEVQPGSFAFMDADYLDTGGLPYAPALLIHATVISRHGDRVVVDAGLKTLSDDSGPARVADPAGATYHHAGDEHGLLSGAGAADLRVGDRVTLIPSHIDTTINLHSLMTAHRGGRVAELWPVAARGRVS